MTRIVNGMIFAAGLGTRLAPLTNDCPKALVKVAGRPLLDLALAHFASSGVNHVVVNVHHFAQQVIDFVEANRDKWNCEIVVSDESDQLLDTGGGLAKALPLFDNDGPVVVANADVVCNASISELLLEHERSAADVTLLTGGRKSTRNLLFDIEGRLAGWRNSVSGDVRMARSVEAPFAEAFNGFHVVSQDFIRDLLPARPLPIIQAYLERAQQFNIRRMRMPMDRFWFDVGTTEKLAMAEAFLDNHPDSF